MRRYFFNVASAGERLIDSEGQVLDEGGVAKEAVAVALELAKAEFTQALVGAVTVSVHDEAGSEVFKGKLTLESDWSL